MSVATKRGLFAGFAIIAVLGLVAVGFVPFPLDSGNRRWWVFVFAAIAVALSLWKMALTIWIYRREDNAFTETQKTKHEKTLALLDIFTVATGAPAAILGALSFAGWGVA